MVRFIDTHREAYGVEPICALRPDVCQATRQPDGAKTLWKELR